MKTIIIFCSILIFSGMANAFEKNSFKTGMTYAEVLLMLEQMNYSIVSQQDSNIYSTAGKNGRLNNFIFCNKKLVGYQIDYEPSIKNAILLADEYTKKFGSATTTRSNIKLTQVGQINSWSTIWVNKTDYYQINLTSIPNNDSLYLYMESKNTCW